MQVGAHGHHQQAVVQAGDAGLQAQRGGIQQGLQVGQDEAGGGVCVHVRGSIKDIEGLETRFYNKETNNVS